MVTIAEPNIYTCSLVKAKAYYQFLGPKNNSNLISLHASTIVSHEGISIQFCVVYELRQDDFIPESLICMSEGVKRSRMSDMLSEASWYEEEKEKQRSIGR